ncbi:hypothetical protein D918_04838 [Trichuris suis]|nr:hypothetical protein D918_04838 [Trichuris suis]
MDFSEHFWGDKHNGFAVMYQIMKGGQQTVKDLFDLIKERAGVEDDNHRHGAKTVKLICNFDNHRCDLSSPIFNFASASSESKLLILANEEVYCLALVIML